MPLNPTDILFDIFSSISDKDIEYGLKLKTDDDLFIQEMKNPQTDNSLIVVCNDNIYHLAKLYIECDKDIVATKLAYDHK